MVDDCVALRDRIAGSECDGGAQTGVTMEMACESERGPWLVEAGPVAEPPSRTVSPGETITVGSSGQVDIRVFDRAVSGRHCSLELRDGRMVVRDLGSRNGVYVGGARLERAVLSSGSSCAIGNAMLTCAVSSESLAGSNEPEGPPLPGIVGASGPMRRVMREVRRLADIRGAVHLRGETGTGKDVLARAIHLVGPRRNRPFLPLNVGTLPRELADAELFGFERGAFTGAHAARDGAFVEAHAGTLFLDEIAELPLELQVKLLRVLEDGEVRPLGARVSRKVDVRVVSATWAPLHRRVAEGAFRQDLYQRLAVFVLEVPPLRERRSDIPALVSCFLAELRSEVGEKELSTAALSKLGAYAWPGNVRELRNVLYRAAVRSSGHLIRSADISESLSVARAPARVVISGSEARALVDSHGGNVSAAARQLGVARSTLRGWIGMTNAVVHRSLVPSRRDVDETCLQG
jgi:transcriptional regulator of acetoin/glycerol metabolism